MDIKQKLIALAIAIVLVAFVSVGIDTFYKEPENKCYIMEAVPKTLNCELLEDKNKTECYYEEQKLRDEESIKNQKCYEEFRPIENLYKRNVFIILTIIGVLTILIGLFLKDVAAVYLGLMIGGIVIILEGIIRYWANMNEYFRFVILGILLILLIWISYKKLR